MGILTYIKIGAFVVLASAIAGAYWYFNWSQKEMQQLRENNVLLETSLAQSEAAIAALRDSMRESVERFNQAQSKFQQSQKNVIVLRDKLGKHELGALARAKPGLVEKLVNRGSERANRCLEIITGSPLTEEERSATKKSEINTECPDIANPNYKGDE